MALPFILVVCLAGVVCLTPLAIYLLWLATITRRHRSTIVSGQWDFAALLVGLSGFILFGGGLLLALIQSNVRFLMRGNMEALRAAWGQERTAWLLVVVGYLVVVIGGILLTLAARRRSLVIYNVDPVMFELTLAEVLETLGRPIERRGNTWVGGIPLFEVEPFPAGRTLTLRWISDDALLFQEVERLIKDALPSPESNDNPATRWLMSTVVGCTAVIVCSLLLLLYGLALIR